jgi:hypothetical protein
MRAYEIYESSTRKPQITLRLLNRLKHIRKRNKQAHDAKMALLPQMYSGERLADEAELKDDITDEIDKAEIDAKQKQHIESMAMNAVKRQRKS